MAPFSISDCLNYRKDLGIDGDGLLSSIKNMRKNLHP